MKITKELEAEISAMMDDYWGSYFRGDLEHWQSYLVDDYRNIGGTEEEIWNSKQEIVEYTHRVIDQMAGMIEIRNKQAQIIPYDGYLMVHEFMDFFIRIDEKWTFYGKFRLSTLIQKIDGAWKVLHQHGSYPDSHTEQGETFAFDTLRKENTQLREAVKRRTVELENKNYELKIEAALERVRARTMAMQKSEELANVAFVLFEQLRVLGGNLWGTGFGLCEMDSDKDSFWFANENGVFPPVAIPNTTDPAHSKMYEGWKAGKDFLALEASGKKLKSHYDYMLSLQEVKPFFQKILDEGLSLPEWQQWNAAYFKHGYLLIITLEPYPDPDILVRFAGVFDQTYTRFLDLKNAEAQAKEANIQLALERVRAKTMAMKTQGDLLGIIELFGEQLNAVDVRFDDVTIIDGPITKNRDWELWSFVPEAENLSHKILIPYIDTPYFTKTAEAVEEYEKTGNPIQVKSFTKKEKDEFIDHYRKYAPEVVDEVSDLVYANPGSVIVDAFLEEVTISLVRWDLELYTDEELEIFERFAKEFRRTYIRFLDIIKAEAQARESEIQLALERVRARSMAMHKSEELADLSMELVQQVQALGINTWFCAFNIYDDHPDGSLEWGSNGQGTFPKYRTPREGVFLDYYEAGQRGETLLVNEIGEEDCPAHYDYLCSLPGVGEQLLQMKAKGIPFPASQIDHAAFFKYGYILFITFEPVPEAHNVFKRFARVFQQTYTRFLDLQKSEEQAREAKIEAALERVRARSMGMHKSDDLIDVVREIGKGIHELGIQLHYSQIYTDYTYDPKTGLNIWVDVEGRDYLEKFHLPYIDHSITLNFNNALNEGLDYFSERYSKAEKDSYFKLLFKYSDLKRIPKKRKELILNASGWTRFTVILNEATLNFGRYSLDEFTDEEHEIFKRFAKVFGQAYTRFLDLQKAEEQAKEAQIEAALERVRSRSLAMHKTDELQDVVRVVAEELKNTGVILDTGGAVICTYFQDSKDVIHWTATEDPAHPSVPYFLPYFEDELFDEAWESKSRGDDYFAKIFSYDVKNAFFSHAFEHSEYRQLPDEYKKVILESKSHGIAWAWSENSAIMIPSIQGDLPSEEEKRILIRFAKVFEQSFIRFLDLQKAEEQAREAQIETALERVRARSMGMQKSGELIDVVRQIGKEVSEMDIDVQYSQIWTDFSTDPDDGLNIWVDVHGQSYLEKFHIPFVDQPITSVFYEALEKNLDFFSERYSKSEKDRFFRFLFKNSDLKSISQERKDLTLNAPGWIRFTVILNNSCLHFGRYNLNEFAEEEKDIFKRFGKVFDQAYTRFLDLQKAEAQAREAKIETALEKVRSRTMGMQSSDELPEVANLLFLEVQDLGIPAWSCGYNIMEEDKKSAIGWMSSEGVLQEPFKLRLYGEASFDEMREFLRSDETMLVQELGGEALEGHYEHMKSFPDLRPTFENIEAQGLSLPTFQINHLCKFSRGFLLFITYEPVPDAHGIFERFTNVFDQTYTRFLDLKKAEAQARESQIEAALERVRSRSMGMQKSSDLQSVVDTMYGELKRLGLVFHAVVIQLLLDDTKDMYMWINVGDGSPYDDIIHWPYVDIPMFNAFYEARIGNKTFDYRTGSEAETREFFEEYFKLDVVPKERKEVLKNVRLIDNIGTYQKHTGVFLMRHTEGEYSEKDKEIVHRFSKVFEQTYTRFLDLEKAEKQAREAQIETALERVRARSMGMQKSDELIKVVRQIGQELKEMGIDVHNSQIWTDFSTDPADGLNLWIDVQGQSYLEKFHIPYVDHPITSEFYEALDKNRNFFSDRYSKSEKDQFFRFLFKNSDLKSIPQDRKDLVLNAPSWIRFTVILNNSCLHFARYNLNEFTEEEKDIFKRIGKVFGQAYTRFLDLQKAEAQAAEAIKQASLDRVRGEIASMRSTDDLQNITPLIWNELKTLDVSFIRCGVFIIHEDEHQVEVYLSKPDGTSLAVMHLPFGDNELVNKTVDAWQQSSVYTQHWTKEEFLNWGRSMMEQNQVADMKTYQGAEEAPKSLNLHFIPFNQGMLYVGSTESLNDEEIGLSESLAKAFSIAYARYEDFVKLEKAKASIEDALTELKATQSQLIQQEKLASLGQLTAGIAHEIKNPLNFVNNFSELSLELVEEVRDEIRRMTEDRGPESQKAKVKSEKENSPLEGSAEAEHRRGVSSPFEGGEDGEAGQGDDRGDDRSFILDILNDIEANLKTIHKHGSRADGIVKSMLQHSRGGDGKMESTPLNPIIKEYVNLAFHGMRAGKDPIYVDMDLQLDENIGEVPLIAEDFSRVILNLVNNAFDAMRSLSAERSALSESYHPKLTVRTQKTETTITIEIEDNGPGIPEEMKDKILQPFFTTKKGTAGTGLGLSITNDIIKAHGGSLNVHSQPGQTTFMIKLTG